MGEGGGESEQMALLSIDSLHNQADDPFMLGEQGDDLLPIPKLEAF